MREVNALLLYGYSSFIGSCSRGNNENSCAEVAEMPVKDTIQAFWRERVKERKVIKEHNKKTQCAAKSGRTVFFVVFVNLNSHSRGCGLKTRIFFKVSFARDK